MRLQKYMSDAGIASRRKCEELISSSRVKVNGVTAEIGATVEPGDRVELDGKVVEPPKRKVVIAFFKPRSVMCTASDPEGRATVNDFFRDYPERLYNVGRLDYDSEGLILMTNDGELANALMHPKHMVEKTYYVICDGVLMRGEQLMLERGVMLDDRMTYPARVSDIHKLTNGNTCFLLTIHEGRNREVRRMVEATGHRTLLLRRVSEGSVTIGELKPGEWRELSEAEVMTLRNAIMK